MESFQGTGPRHQLPSLSRLPGATIIDRSWSAPSQAHLSPQVISWAQLYCLFLTLSPLSLQNSLLDMLLC